MTAVKIAVVGGGSYQWMPVFLSDIVLTEGLAGSEVFLDDINKDALALTSALGRKMATKSGADIRIRAATNKDEALDNADFVILTISTGGLDTMANDIEIPKKYGIYQSVGDTCGPGGISRALRNIPVVIELARKMERLCPKAILMNYSNPMSTMTRAVNRETGTKCVGFCHELFGTIDGLKRIFEVEDESRFEIEVCGVNHLPWIIGLRLDGEDAFPALSRYIDKHKYIPCDDDPNDRSHGVFGSEYRIKFGLFRAYGALPAAGDRHLAEFFPYFLTEKSRWGLDYGIYLTPISYRRDWAEDDRNRIERMLDGSEEVRLKRSREAAAGFISSVANNTRGRDIVNIPNKGTVPGLPDDTVVEVFADVDASGVKGVKVSNVPEAVMAVLRYHVAIHELTVEAAVKGDRAIALQAFMLDPMMREFNDVEKMMAEMLAANKDYLPQFSL